VTIRHSSHKVANHYFVYFSQQVVSRGNVYGACSESVHFEYMSGKRINTVKVSAVFLSPHRKVPE